MTKHFNANVFTFPSSESSSIPVDHLFVCDFVMSMMAPCPLQRQQHLTPTLNVFGMNNLSEKVPLKLVWKEEEGREKRFIQKRKEMLDSVES